MQRISGDVYLRYPDMIRKVWYCFLQCLFLHTLIDAGGYYHIPGVFIFRREKLEPIYEDGT